MMSQSKKKADKTATAGTVHPENQATVKRFFRISKLTSALFKQDRLPALRASIRRRVREGKFSRSLMLGGIFHSMGSGASRFFCYALRWGDSMSAAPMTSIEEKFREAMAVHGLNPTEIIADGERHRFDCDDEKKGRKSGWYRLHGDGVPAGSFGSWKDDINEKWCSKSDQAFTPIERNQYRERIDKARQEAELTRLQLEADAAKVCTRIMATALDATDDNPYCARKGIKPYGLKEFKDKRTLIVPIRDGTGSVTSSQFIYEDGTKRFKTHGKVAGCYYSFGGKPVEALLICEGFATGASLYQATGYPVAVAFNAGNLEAVARVLRAKLPEIRIIICADNDRFNIKGNVGIIKAQAAALTVGGLLASPVFQSDDGRSQRPSATPLL
jgi:putative DNA primase/helicase